LEEPFMHLLTQGMVLNEIFYRRESSSRTVYFNPVEVELKFDDKGQRISTVLKSDGKPVESAGIGTMSKSRNNGVDPQELIEKYGADTARLYMMFASPPEDTLLWSDASIEGPSSFLKRLWRAVHEQVSSGPVRAYAGGELSPALREIRFELHRTIAKVSDDIGRRFTFNTAIAACMELLNELGRGDDDSAQGRAVMQEALEAVVLMLSPIVPHAAQAMWRALGHDSLVVDERWPKADPVALVQDTIEIVVQVNGKLRGRIAVAAGADEAVAREAALADPGVAKFVAGQPVRKLIYVPGKLVNVVV